MVDAARLRIDIGNDESSAEDKATLAQAMAQELRGPDDVQEVKRATEEAAEDSRPVEASACGALLLALAQLALTKLQPASRRDWR